MLHTTKTTTDETTKIKDAITNQLISQQYFEDWPSNFHYWTGFIHCALINTPATNETQYKELIQLLKNLPTSKTQLYTQPF